MSTSTSSGALIATSKNFQRVTFPHPHTDVHGFADESIRAINSGAQRRLHRQVGLLLHAVVHFMLDENRDFSLRDRAPSLI